MPGRLEDLLEDAAQRQPEHQAVVGPGSQASYEALFARANQIGHALLAAGVVPGDRVGLLAPKSSDAVAALYGVLTAGGCCVPLDVSSPAARLRSIADDCELSAVVVTSDTIGRLEWPESLTTCMVLDADERAEGVPPSVVVHGMSWLAAQPATRPSVTGAVPDQLAYVLYTSGSTGRPKGIMLSHANVLAFVRWASTLFAVGPDDVLASHAPFHFDLSTFDLFAAACGGASVALVPARASVFPNELLEFVRRSTVTIWYSVPSALTQLVQRTSVKAEDLSTLRLVLFAGEVFPARPLRRLLQLVPSARVCNLYGPSETNVCTWFELSGLDSVPDEGPPIGRPIDGVRCEVVGDDGLRVKPGETGELLVSGSTVMMGYWNDPAGTDRSLIRIGGDVYFRTGDLVRSGEGGTLHFVGRRDSLVKSRGYRIELGEVEAALQRHPAVAECAVTAHRDELITNRLTAWVVLADAGGSVTAGTLRAFCRNELPPYMVPGEVRVVAALPRTSSGKIDRVRLSGQ